MGRVHCEADDMFGQEETETVFCFFFFFINVSEKNVWKVKV